MAVSTSANDWKLTVNSGGKLVPNGQILSHDGKFSIVIFKSQIRVYSLSTRQCIRSIKIDKNFNNISDLVLSVKNTSILYIFYNNNKVLVLNWKDKTIDPVLNEFEIDSSNGSILKFIRFQNSQETELLFITNNTSNTASNNGINNNSNNNNTNTNKHVTDIVYFNTDTNQTQSVLSIKNCSNFSVSINKNHLIFLTNKNDLEFVELNDIALVNKARNNNANTTNNNNNNTNNIIQRQKHIKFIFKTPIVSMAISNEPDPIVALGTSSGIIQVISINDSSKPQRLLKWHIDQVKALSFNQNDTYLISGGLEKVLVYWQLDTQKQQFLPRLNGCISKITLNPNNEELLELIINLNDDEMDIEYLVLSTVDLTSRLNVNGLRPKFQTPLNTIEKDKKRLIRQQNNLTNDTITKIKHDYTSNFEVNQYSKLVYVPNGAYLQAYDPIKNEQEFVTTAAPTIQSGKVRNEVLIQDPSIELFAFSHDGNWMCSFDYVPTPELDHLLSSKDIKYSLKFWKYVEKPLDNTNGNNDGTTISNANGHWELSTKIVNPHDPGVPIVSMIPAPESYYGGLGFLTADNKGGLRLWRPRVPKEIYKKIGKDTSNLKLQQTAWTLRKYRNGDGKFETKSISLAWSQDASIIALGQEVLITLIDMYTFKDMILPEEVRFPSLPGSRIRSLNIIDNRLIVLSKTKLISFNLLTFKNESLSIKVNMVQGGKNLLAIDKDRNLICCCINYYHSKTFDLRSRIFIFKPDSLTPIFIEDYDKGISSIKYSSVHSSFIFIDTEAKIGTIMSLSSTSKSAIDLNNDDVLFDKEFEFNTLLSNAKQMATLRRENAKSDSGDDSATDSYTTGPNTDLDDDDDEATLTHRLLNANLFDAVLENTDGLPVEALFERVMLILN